MEQLVRVKNTCADGTAWVYHIRQSACSGDCHKCSGCGAAQETIVLQAQNPIGAMAGDRVMIETQSGPVLRAAAVLYLMPLALFFLGYLAFALTIGYGAMGGLLGFILGVLLAVAYDRVLAKKGDTKYIITGYADASQEKRG